MVPLRTGSSIEAPSGLVRVYESLVIIFLAIVPWQLSEQLSMQPDIAGDPADGMQGNTNYRIRWYSRGSRRGRPSAAGRRHSAMLP
jgi:hypothetical protein